mmetsp:Transcript_24218/g.36314  ORF Transcript_24218/g.36314 Transcript_24218/m.36314 type:complete len:124 (+) Transcript_24218:264-635(+)
MIHSKGKRYRTRSLFKKNIPQKRNRKNITNKKNIQKRDKISISIDSSVKKDLPSKWYFGKTATILSVNKNNASIVVRKTIKNKIFRKILYLDYNHINVLKELRTINNNIHANNIKDNYITYKL